MNHLVCKVEVQGFLPIELPPRRRPNLTPVGGRAAAGREIADASGVWSAEDATTWRRIAEYVEDELADTLSAAGSAVGGGAVPLDARRGALRGARVLELGCGTGACGLYAAHCGATSAPPTAADAQPLIDANVSNPAPGCAVRSQRYVGRAPPAGRSTSPLLRIARLLRGGGPRGAGGDVRRAARRRHADRLRAEHRSRGPNFGPTRARGGRDRRVFGALRRCRREPRPALRLLASERPQGGARQLRTTRRTARCLRWPRRDLRKFALRLTGSPL